MTCGWSRSLRPFWFLQSDGDVLASCGVNMSDSCCCIRPRLPSTTSSLTLADRWEHVLARWGVRRCSHRVDPGLYTLGNPSPESPVFVTANYTLSFDALRSSLAGIDGYIMVLDTRGINVWCAAGKGTFGTDELTRRIDATLLPAIVSQRTLILPQLGATGVAGHEVKKRSGFRVEYGPVRARDLPEYLKTHEVTPEMRRVQFDLLDRLNLVPVELVHVLLPVLVAAAMLLAAFGPLASGAAVASVLAGAVLFPLLLPWIPTPNFSTKGLVLGAVVALPFAAAAFLSGQSPGLGRYLAEFLGNGTVSGAAQRALIVEGPRAAVAAGALNAALPVWWRIGYGLVYMLCMPPVTAYLALNFTGSTTFTSKTGVHKEIYKYIPVMAWMLGVGIALGIVLAITKS